ncbi:hypothetical protein EDB19DRAFT_1641443, partial [Suillus lakei]
DAVTISRLYQDTSTIIDISTSLPHLFDEPAYSRPSLPYIRSHVACKLFHRPILTSLITFSVRSVYPECSTILSPTAALPG